MRVSGLLPRLSCITSKIDLQAYQISLVHESEELQQKQNTRKRQRTMSLTAEVTCIDRNNTDVSSMLECQYLYRVGVDVSTWVARACHGHGALLLDDRQLSNKGRCELLHEKNLQNNTRKNKNHKSSSKSSFINNTNNLF